MGTQIPNPAGPGAQRLAVVSRLAAAALGGYALSHATAIGAARLLPVTRSDAVMAAMMLSFAVFTAAIVWAFSARSARLAWAGLLLPTVIIAATLWWTGGVATP